MPLLKGSVFYINCTFSLISLSFVLYHSCPLGNLARPERQTSHDGKMNIFCDPGWFGYLEMPPLWSQAGAGSFDDQGVKLKTV